MSDILLRDLESCIHLFDPLNSEPKQTSSSTNHIFYGITRIPGLHSQNANKIEGFLSVRQPYCILFGKEPKNLTDIQLVLPLTVISEVKEESNVVKLTCKDLRVFYFKFPPHTSTQSPDEEIRRFVTAISIVPQPLAFLESKSKNDFIKTTDWDVFDWEEEFFDRQGLSRQFWRLTEANKKFELIETYPKYLVVPIAITDEDLKMITEFRERKRIPALCWQHPKTKSTLSRSSQPKVGWRGKRSEKDEKLIYYLRMGEKPDSETSSLCFIDCRPAFNATANKMKGGGTESPIHYLNCNIEYMNIGNIHDMRNSFCKLASHCTKTQPKIINNLPNKKNNSQRIKRSGSNVSNSQIRDSSNGTSIGYWWDLYEAQQMWYSHINKALVAAQKIVELMERRSEQITYCADCTDLESSDENLENSKDDSFGGSVAADGEENNKDDDDSFEDIPESYSVLVHCTDGWDRTSQLTSLAQLIMDEFYRTIKGFQILIEKEWCSFGHKFQDRCGHSDKIGSNIFFSHQERSPIFLQFIDCVWQIYIQNMETFEFNEKYLIFILDNMYSCRYGTFLFTCEKERVESKLYKRTQSLWSIVNNNLQVKNLFSNPKYRPEKKVNLPLGVQLWRGYFLRFVVKVEESQQQQHLHNSNNNNNNNNNSDRDRDSRCNSVGHSRCNSVGHSSTSSENEEIELIKETLHQREREMKELHNLLKINNSSQLNDQSDNNNNKNNNLSSSSTTSSIRFRNENSSDDNIISRFGTSEGERVQGVTEELRCIEDDIAEQDLETLVGYERRENKLKKDIEELSLELFEKTKSIAKLQAERTCLREEVDDSKKIIKTKSDELGIMEENLKKMASDLETTKKELLELRQTMEVKEVKPVKSKQTKMCLDKIKEMVALLEKEYEEETQDGDMKEDTQDGVMKEKM